MKINVCKRHFGAGTRNNSPYTCPVAYALAESFPNSEISVETYRITINKQIYVTPIVVSDFMDRWENYGDAGIEFSFDLV